MDTPFSPQTPVRPVTITTETIALAGDLGIPLDARGIVVFAHGSGSSRQSPRNRFVAEVLREAGLATLLMDLLTEPEEIEDLRTSALRFDIGLLSQRLVGATDWLTQQPETSGLRIGYFGASTGAGAAIVAASERPDLVGAIVSRGGRPDLAGPALGQIRAPTLFIVGGNDQPVVEMNQNAMRQMQAHTRLEIVPGATHLFEEPGALEQVAVLARTWFAQYLADSHPPTDDLRISDTDSLSG